MSLSYEHFFQRLQISFHQGRVLSLPELIANQITKKEEIESLFIWYNLITTCNYLENLINQAEDFEELIIIAPDHIYKKQQKKYFPLPQLTLNQDELQLSFEILAMRYNINWNYQYPFVSFDIAINHKNFRLSLIHHSCTADHKSRLYLRNKRSTTFTLQQFGPPQLYQPIELAIKQRQNIIISGATSSGKTTLIQTIINLLPSSEHLIILEDTKELTSPFALCSHLLASSTSNKTLEAYCRYLLRMTPDRVILGEIRSQEIIPLLLNSNIGVRGLLTSLHANSAKDAIDRLNLLFQLYGPPSLNTSQGEKLISRNIDLIVHLQDKRIDHILKLEGHNGHVPLYEVIKADS